MAQQSNLEARFAKGDLLRARTSEYPAGYVRSVSSDRKGVWYIVGFGRGRSKREQMLREEAAVLVRSNAETDAMLAQRLPRGARMTTPSNDRAVAAGHTPGPWFSKGRYIGTKNHMSYIGECRNAAGNFSDDAPASGNAAFIAHACNSHYELIKALEQIATVDMGGGFLAAQACREVARQALAKALGK
jgi:hypothetical protein